MGTEELEENCGFEICNFCFCGYEKYFGFVDVVKKGLVFGGGRMQFFKIWDKNQNVYNFLFFF